MQGEVESEALRKTTFKIALRKAEFLHQDNMDTHHDQVLHMINNVIASRKENPDEIIGRVVIIDQNITTAGKPIGVSVPVDLRGPCPPTKLTWSEQLQIDAKKDAATTKENAADIEGRRSYVQDWTMKHREQITWAACRAFKVVPGRNFAQGLFPNS